VDAVRAYLGKRGAVLAVVERVYPPAGPAAPSSKIELDPALAREIAQLGPELGATVQQADTPTPRALPLPSTKPASTPMLERPLAQVEVHVPLDVVHRTASKAAARMRNQSPQNAADDALTPTLIPTSDVEPTQVRRTDTPRKQRPSTQTHPGTEDQALGQ